MPNPKKIISIVLIAELILGLYCFIARPECEPCPPDVYCPPCISHEQVIAIWIGVILAALALGYALYDNFKKRRK